MAERGYNTNPPTNAFSKGNQMAKLGKGIPKSPVKKAIPTELLQHSLNQFTEEKINLLINNLSARDQLQFYVKITEMLLKRQTDEIQTALLMERLKQLEFQLNPVDPNTEIIISYLDQNKLPE